MKVITTSGLLLALSGWSSSDGVHAHPGLTKRQLKGSAPCPFLQTNQQRRHRVLAERTGDGGIPEDGGFAAVQEDLTALLTNSQDDFWPADFGHYGGLFIRLAWHCSGSYRESDGRGGCDGGRIRFDPELGWEDNVNLDKALQLLQPIKDKYGPSLSWGDLIILSGTTAIEAMGGPVLGFCGGRIDDADGSESFYLGPSPQQEAIAPCLTVGMNGKCLDVNGTAMGPTTMELIYVNPAGPVDGRGDPIASGADIRKAFARMGFDDRTSVALIGGGHAFGKCHGPCENPPCGVGTDSEGKGPYTWTSGFEGAWTTLPTQWTNQYFTNLFEYEWNRITGPGGNIQWEPVTAQNTTGPPIIMLTTDVALARDEIYKPITQEYAADIASLETDFAEAWYRLTSADMGPAIRCIGDNVPPPQPFQYTLPDAPETLPDYIPIRKAIQTILDENENAADALINLAYRASSTHRATDYRGGVNGARIRFEPESTWPSNEGTADALMLLEPVKEQFSDATYADLIVLAGITALEQETEGLELAFCGGYVDADNGNASEGLAPRIYSTPYITVKDDCEVKGLSMEECVALASRNMVSSQYYTDLLAGSTEKFDEYELALLEEEFKPIVQKFAADEDALKTTFSAAWNKVMTADRYLNYRENACTGVKTATTMESSETSVNGHSEVETNGDSGAEDSKQATNGSTGSTATSDASSPVLMMGPLVAAAALAFLL